MKKQYILGISAYFHDSSASLICNDEIIAAATEERFSRIKHDPAFPIQSIKFCLKKANITISDISYITYYEKPLLTFDRIIESYFTQAPKGFSQFRTSLPLWIKNKLFIKKNISLSLQDLGLTDEDQSPEIIFSAHHLSHARSAFSPSPFKSAAILCIDGVGEYATTTIWHGKGDDIKLLKEINFPHSLGLLYSAFTYFCGFEVNDGEYKLMGLAPYGKPVYKDIILKELIDLKDDGSFKLNMKYFSYESSLEMTNSKFAKLFNGPKRDLDSKMTQREMDIAASIQCVLEIALLRICDYIKSVTNEKNLCLAGGVALNCVANGKLLKSGIFEKIWIQPAAGDSGASLGAALATYYDYLNLSKKNLTQEMKSCFLGPSYTDEEIIECLDYFGASYKKLDQECLIQTTAQIIQQDKVIGWFQGESEFGPRALGNRSIIGNACSPNLQKEINLKIKFRESFRPFAPAMLEKEAKQLFPVVHSSPYMLLVDFFLNDNKKNQLFPSVTHIDGSARIQTVTKDNNELFYRLLSELKELTGHGVIINTSFNVRDEPIVDSPIDAYKCFMKTNMDYLVVGDYILNKEKQPPLKENYLKSEPDTVRRKDFLLFWSKFYLIILILFYITLPFLGLKRTAFPAILGPIPLLLSFLLNNELRKLKNMVTYLGTNIQLLINTVILAIVYYGVFTPYAFIIKLFSKNRKIPTTQTYWQDPRETSINTKMY